MSPFLTCDLPFLAVFKTESALRSSSTWETQAPKASGLVAYTLLYARGVVGTHLAVGLFFCLPTQGTQTPTSAKSSRYYEVKGMSHRKLSPAALRVFILAAALLASRTLDAQPPAPAPAPAQVPVQYPPNGVVPGRPGVVPNYGGVPGVGAYPAPGYGFGINGGYHGGMPPMGAGMGGFGMMPGCPTGGYFGGASFGYSMGGGLPFGCGMASGFGFGMVGMVARPVVIVRIRVMPIMRSCCFIRPMRFCCGIRRTCGFRRIGCCRRRCF